MKDTSINFKLWKELQLRGVAISQYQLAEALVRVGARLLTEEQYQNYSWTVAPDRMGQ